MKICFRKNQAVITFVGDLKGFGILRVWTGTVQIYVKIWQNLCDPYSGFLRTNFTGNFSGLNWKSVAVAY